MRSRPTPLTRRLPLCWLLLILFDAGLVVLAVAQEQVTSLAEPQVTQFDDEPNADANDYHFQAIDVLVDTGEFPLAAWQFEFQSCLPGVEIVGIEGGDHPAFAIPPHYDPRALNNDRVILAAFSTADELPVGRSRIARLHLQLKGKGPREFETRVVVMATVGGEPIPGSVSIQKSTI